MTIAIQILERADVLVHKVQQPLYRMAEESPVRGRDTYQEELQWDMRHEIVIVNKPIIDDVVAAIEIEVAYARRAKSVGRSDRLALLGKAVSGQRCQSATQAMSRDIERTIIQCL